MKIYKIKELTTPEYQNHFFEMIELNKIWVSATAKLNDSEEFHFTMDCRPTEFTAMLIKKLSMHNGRSEWFATAAALNAIRDNRIREIAEPIEHKVIKMCRDSFGVTSFTMQEPNTYLWNTYGGEGNGAVIEFDVRESEIGDIFHKVEYVNCKTFHVDRFIESQFENEATADLFASILCTKNSKWSTEKEIRYIAKCVDKSLPFHLPVSKVIIGSCVHESIVERIKSICLNKGYICSYVATQNNLNL